MTGTQALTSRLAGCYSAIVHDVMRAAGHDNFVLPSSIRLLQPEKRLAGPIWTVAGSMNEGADGHETLLAWTGLLARAPAGHAVVCQPNTNKIALMGKLSAETLQYRGILGYVVDGAVRDAELTMRLGFPVACTHLTPLDIVGRWLPGPLAEPIEIGGVVIRTGDYLIADRDGICILPARSVDAIVDAAEIAMGTENSLRKAILNGMDPQEAYRRFGKF